MAALICAAGIRPELEVFELGHIRYARNMIEKGEIVGPPLFQLCLGIPWAADAVPRNHARHAADAPAKCAMVWLWHLHGNLADGGLRPIYSEGMFEWGLEDSLFMSKGVLAPRQRRAGTEGCRQSSTTLEVRWPLRRTRVTFSSSGTVSTVRLSCDTGGTFTDLLVEETDGSWLMTKASTVAEDPIRASWRQCERQPKSAAAH